MQHLINKAILRKMGRVYVTYVTDAEKGQWHWYNPLRQPVINHINQYKSPLIYSNYFDMFQKLTHVGYTKECESQKDQI